jgi:hypothetical protein
MHPHIALTTVLLLWVRLLLPLRFVDDMGIDLYMLFYFCCNLHTVGKRLKKSRVVVVVFGFYFFISHRDAFCAFTTAVYDECVGDRKHQQHKKEEQAEAQMHEKREQKAEKQSLEKARFLFWREGLARAGANIF